MLKGVKGKSISFYNNLLHQLPGLIVVTDKKNHFVYSNNYTAELFGYTNEDNMLGHDPHQIKCPAVECAENFIFQNLEVIRTGCDLTILDIHKYAYGDAKILLTKKKPFRVNGQIEGVICHCTEMHSTALSQTCAALIASDKFNFSKRYGNERTYTIGSHGQVKQLSERELDCVFYILRGNTIKQIAKVLNISPRTVETYLEQAKIKLKCTNRADIVEYGLAEGLLNYIPSSFVTRDISNIIHICDIEAQPI